MPISVVPLKKSILEGSTWAIKIMLESTPPTLSTTATGVRISAKIISVACTVSVQLTARKPPIKVYAMVAPAPSHIALA
jgi:hypothetical protein